MRPKQVTVLALACALLPGCGGHGRGPIRTATPVTGLALDGKRLAWTDCFRIHVLEGKREIQVRLPPAASSACQDEGHLILAGANVGWFFAINDMNSSFALGASSLTLRTSHLLRVEPDWEDGRYLALVGAIAGDRGAILWTWPRVSTLGPPARDCDLLSGGRGCGFGVGGGRVHVWSLGQARLLRRVPPGAPLAASNGWLALGALRTGRFPQSRSAEHMASAPRSIVVIRREDGSVVARVPNRSAVEALALSHHLLAVESADRIVLYRLPGGQRLRSVRVGNRTTYRFTGWMAVAGYSLIIWSPASVRVVDATTGQSTVLVHTRADEGRITAVATDGKRVAWAMTAGLRSVIRIRPL